MSDDGRERARLAPAVATCAVADADGHCVTCSDEALPARVLSIDETTGMARVALANTTVEVDISLVDDVNVGTVVLLHGGVAIALVESP
ncbi:MAG: hypothetical protein NVSMB42_10750 [Herpetosiphon sp.]